MRGKSLTWPAAQRDGPVSAIHKPWFEPALPLGIPASVADYLDCLLHAYDSGQIDLHTALVGEALLLLHGWIPIDHRIDSQLYLHRFWENVFQVTRSPPA